MWAGAYCRKWNWSSWQSYNITEELFHLSNAFSSSWTITFYRWWQGKKRKTFPVQETRNEKAQNSCQNMEWKIFFTVLDGSFSYLTLILSSFYKSWDACSWKHRLRDLRYLRDVNGEFEIHKFRSSLVRRHLHRLSNLALTQTWRENESYLRKWHQ